MAGGALRSEFPDLPPHWAAGAAALAWGLARFLPLAALPGWPLLAPGVGLMGWSASSFRAGRTPIEPRRTP